MSKTGKKKTDTDVTHAFERARDELYSHILRCGVLEAQQEHQKDWFDDTMEYLSERYAELSDDDLARLRTLGERYCQPVIQHGPGVAATR